MGGAIPLLPLHTSMAWRGKKKLYFFVVFVMHTQFILKYEINFYILLKWFQTFQGLRKCFIKLLFGWKIWKTSLPHVNNGATNFLHVQTVGTNWTFKISHHKNVSAHSSLYDPSPASLLGRFSRSKNGNDLWKSSMVLSASRQRVVPIPVFLCNTPLLIISHIPPPPLLLSDGPAGFLSVTN